MVAFICISGETFLHGDFNAHSGKSQCPAQSSFGPQDVLRSADSFPDACAPPPHLHSSHLMKKVKGNKIRLVTCSCQTQGGSSDPW